MIEKLNEEQHWDVDEVVSLVSEQQHGQIRGVENPVLLATLLPKDWTD